MARSTLKVAAVFNRSFGQVFVAGRLENHPQLVSPGSWLLTVNGQAVAELVAVGEQLHPNPATRVVGFRGQLAATLFDLTTDDVRLTQQ